MAWSLFPDWSHSSTAAASLLVGKLSRSLESNFLKTKQFFPLETREIFSPMLGTFDVLHFPFQSFIFGLTCWRKGPPWEWKCLNLIAIIRTNVWQRNLGVEGWEKPPKHRKQFYWLINLRLRNKTKMVNLWHHLVVWQVSNIAQVKGRIFTAQSIYKRWK